MRHSSRGADGVAGWHLELSGVDVLLVLVHVRSRIDSERAVDVRVVIHGIQRQAQRKMQKQVQPTGRGERRETRIRNAQRKAQVDLLPERFGNLVVEEAAQASMLRIDSPQQLALVEAETQTVIRLACSRFPRRFLTRKN